MTQINTKWTTGLESPEEFESKLLEQKYLFGRLYELLEVKKKTNYENSIKKSNYDIANWSEQQADSIGYARCLEEIKTLLKFTQE